MSNGLRELFFETSLRYSSDTKLLDKHWEVLHSAYQDSNRYYHTLDHLTFILERLTERKSFIHDWESVIFATFFHDVVYNILKKDNEKQSDLYAQNFLNEIHYKHEGVKLVSSMIQATAGHELSAIDDINLFTDADLAILGASPDKYKIYQAGIRKEYAWFPTLLYNPGRRKVIQYFLAMQKIFKTSYFSEFESQARTNLQLELESLS